MPKKNDAPAAAEEPVVETPQGVETPQVVVFEQPTADESAPRLSAQTIAEMAAGREALQKHANNP